ncbi:unnamed protein product, partial [Polarella glacialis]
VGGGPAAEVRSGRSPQQAPRIPRQASPSSGSEAQGRSWGSAAPPPVDLEVGEVLETLQVEAGAKCAQRYVLQGNEYVSWVCSVKDGYTIDFSVKVCCRRPRSEVQCVGRPLRLVGVDGSRVVSDT